MVFRSCKCLFPSPSLADIISIPLTLLVLPDGSVVLLVAFRAVRASLAAPGSQILTAILLTHPPACLIFIFLTLFAALRTILSMTSVISMRCISRAARLKAHSLDFLEIGTPGTPQSLLTHHCLTIFPNAATISILVLPSRSFLADLLMAVIAIAITQWWTEAFPDRA